MLSLRGWRPEWLPVPAPTQSHDSHPLTIRSKGLKKLIKRIVKQEAAEQEAERRSIAAVCRAHRRKEPVDAVALGNREPLIELLA